MDKSVNLLARVVASWLSDNYHLKLIDNLSQVEADRSLSSRGKGIEMIENHQWMPNSLFDMAAYCEKNGLDKPRDLLIEAAVMLHISLANREPMPMSATPRSQYPVHPAKEQVQALVLDFPHGKVAR